MNLVIDIGNTLLKYAVFDHKRMLTHASLEMSSSNTKIKAIFTKYPKITHAIVSSVATVDENLYRILSQNCKAHQLSYTSKIPFKNNYTTPKTLGMDRIALVTAAFYQNPKSNTLVIDMGTCITYDLLTDGGEYMGGAISLGVTMRYKALHQQTDKLPLLNAEMPSNYIGNTTANSIHSGVMGGVLNELDGIIRHYKKQFEHLTVILTGGDSHFFAKRLKNSIFAHSKFLLKGLNYLLEYNKS